MGGLSQHGKKVFKLNRTTKERWHLNRTLVTQLVEHERIQSTHTKCKGLRALAERVMVLAKRVSEKNDENARRELQGILTTSYAQKKVVMEIAPRYKDKQNCFTRIKTGDFRLGDHAQTAYIEFIGNELERYENTAQQERINSGKEVDEKQWELDVLKQERDFFSQKLDDIDEEIKLKSVDNQEQFLQGRISKQDFDNRELANQGQKQFFQQKLQRVEHDLFIANKNPFDLIKYPNANFIGQNQQQQLN